MRTETQQDHEVRVVALANLRAMCEHLSTVTHIYRVEKVSRSRVHVSYQGPCFDEQGYQEADAYVMAVFPCYPSSVSSGSYGKIQNEDGSEEDNAIDDTQNPRIVLDILRILHEDEERDYDASQYFAPLLGCPILWRGTFDSKEWKTRREWDAETGKRYDYPRAGSVIYDSLPGFLRAYVDARGRDELEPSPVNEKLLRGWTYEHLTEGKDG